MTRVLLPVAVVGLLSGCGSSSTAPKAAATGPFDATYRAVCEAAQVAREGDTTKTRTVFIDRAHQGVHQLASKAAERDRPAAGRMLERKERVEHDLDAKATATQLAADLDALATTARTAIAATGAPRPQPCQETLR
jgi:uncharacterized protein YceK